MIVWQGIMRVCYVCQYVVHIARSGERCTVRYTRLDLDGLCLVSVVL